MASFAERHVINRAVRVGVRLGRDIDGIRELEVTGRRTGRPRRTPVKVLVVDGERYVVSLSGASGWVRNLRARNAARLCFGRRVEDVVATELSDAEKPPIVRVYLEQATRSGTRRRLSWAAEGTPAEEAQRGAARTPVFRLAPVSARESPRGRARRSRG